MPRRFSRIRESSYLQQAVDNYVAFIRDSATRPRNVGGGTPRPPSVELAIQPFGFTLPAGNAVRATATTAARTQMASGVGVYADVPGGALVLQRIPGYKPARITLFIGSGSSQRTTSAITGLPYLKYQGNSFSHPFGQNVNTDLEYEIFTTIRTALLGPNRRLSYTPEKRQQVV